MDSLFDTQQIQAALDQIVLWATSTLFTVAAVAQLAVIATTGAVAAWLAPRLRQIGWRAAQRLPQALRLETVRPTLSAAAGPATWLAFLVVLEAAAERLDSPNRILTVAVSLVAAWLVIRLAAGFIREAFWARVVTGVAWTLAALNILGLLDIVIAALDGLAITLGDMRLSLLLVIKAVLTLAVLLWLAVAISRLAERRIQAMKHLTLSSRALFAKVLHIAFITLAFLVALNAIGIDLTALTVLGGAIGLGLGFGLQKVVSNLVSGVILLMDRSIKPGDVVAVAGTYGRVNAIGARYVSVVTRDGIEHLIPNEELITTRVENWSYSDTRVRLHIPVGIAYNCDPRQAMELCVEAARSVPRVLEAPAPRCLLQAFGDSAVELELRAWITDPEEGVANVSSDILLAIWDRFQAHGITIPFPQRTLHFPEGPIAVRVADAQADVSANPGE